MQTGSLSTVVSKATNELSVSAVFQVYHQEMADEYQEVNPQVLWHQGP